MAYRARIKWRPEKPVRFNPRREAENPELPRLSHDEDRVFRSWGAARCPVCYAFPVMEKKRFGSQNKYRLICQSKFSSADCSGNARCCESPFQTPWVNNHSQARRVWQMNALMGGAKT